MKSFIQGQHRFWSSVRMTAIADARNWYELHKRDGATGVLVFTMYVELALMVVLLAFLPFDSVEVEGRHRLTKPFNFSVSMALYVATVVVFVDHLRASVWCKRLISWGISACMLTAITCITMQAIRGTTSHFNNSTPFDSTVSLLMDIADPLNGVFAFVLLVFALQSRYKVSSPTRWGIAFGIFFFLAGSVVGGLMVMHGRNVVGVPPGGPGLPVLNWSTQGGDLRVAHFLGIHAIQVLPIAGWLIAQLEGPSVRAKVAQVVAVSAAYVVLTGVVLLQALNGVPLIRV